MTASVGAADHAGWAVLVTVGRDGRLLDRRRVLLIDDGLPRMPHHHEAQRLPEAAALELVGRVRASAERCARACLERLAGEAPVVIRGIALRAIPPLPATVIERIRSYHAQTRADGAMYREALAGAASARGWFVHWYDARRVFAAAATALGRESIGDLLEEQGAAFGPPWTRDHRQAMAAAMVASPR